MNSTIHRRKTVTQSSTMSQNNKEHRIHNRENRPYQVSKPCVTLAVTAFALLEGKVKAIPLQA
jgi:hypothetical protein